METHELIPLRDFCINHNIEITFVHSLQLSGLVQVTRQHNEELIDATQLRQLERFVRLHELDINVEGIETIDHLLQHVHRLHAEILSLRNKLQLYEP